MYTKRSRKITLIWLCSLVCLVLALLTPAVGSPIPREALRIGEEFQINTYTTDVQWFPKVSSDPMGNFVVVWGSTADGYYGGIFGQRYSNEGTPLANEFRINSYTSGGQFDPRVSSDAAGNVVVVWKQLGGGIEHGIFGQRYSSSGEPVGSEFPVTTASNPFGIALSSDAVGNFIVAWAGSGEGDNSGIFGRRYSNRGAPLGNEFRVNTYTTNAQNYPSVHCDAVGNFVVVWHGAGDGDDNGIFAQRYSNTGEAIGLEFRVNSYTTGNQSSPAIASTAAGDFVVVWGGAGQGDDFYADSSM